MAVILRFLGLASAAVFTLPAGAVTWTATDYNPSGAENCLVQTCQFSVTSSGNTAKFKAYSNSAWAGSGAAGPIGQGNLSSGGTNNSTGWIEARNVFYGSDSGFGIKNVNQVSATEEDATPEHAIDNKEVLEMMVIELPKIDGFVWDLESLKLGWAQEAGISSNAADVSMFIGGAGLASGYDFTGVCFDAAFGGSCGAGQKALSTLGGGFSDITNAIANNGNNLVQDTTYGVNSAATGNYIIVAGRLGDNNDAFKLKNISASLIPGGPGGNAPIPGTLALLGLGLAGLIGMQRRARAA